MIKAIIGRGIGFTLGTISYIPTHGFGIGAAVSISASAAAQFVPPVERRTYTPAAEVRTYTPQGERRTFNA